MIARRDSAAVLRVPIEPPAWRFSARSTAVRLFLTCWLIYVLHFASNTVREIYLGLAIGDHFSFRVDEYAHLHPDLFEKPGYGWHINSNPGGSMVGAIPYALARPFIDAVVERVNRQRNAAGNAEPPAYNSPWPMAREFYRESWRRGYDVKFGLAALVMQAFAMAPVSALGVVAMFYALRSVFRSDRAALWLSVLYAFGTPVFYRTGYLNHNLLLGHLAFLGFIAMGKQHGAAKRMPLVLGGLAGGAALLFDYSGAVVLLALFVYAACRHRRRAAWYVLGSVFPVLLLWFYQWRSFGHPLFPAQQWMPPVAWIDRGYQGFQFPQLDLLALLMFDYRYGLVLTCPLLLLAAAAPFVHRGRLPRLELWTMLGVFLGLWVFCAGVNYSRLQFNTGLRHLAPALPFLFVPAALALMRLPRRAAYFIGVLSIAQAWSMAMYRDVERGLGLLEPVLHVFFGGFQLPVFTVLSQMGAQYGDYFARGVSPLPALLLAAALIYGIWSPRLASSRAVGGAQ
jgi:hypothetical protein